MNMIQMLAQFQQFKKNPMAMLLKKYNIPGNLNSPDDVLKHLVSSGQVSQDQLEQVKAVASMFGG